MTRPLTATIASPTGTPREGLTVEFNDMLTSAVLTARTDASGVFIVALEVGVPYAVGFVGAMRLDGIDYRAVTLLRLLVPEGDGPVTLAECITEALSTSWPVLLRRLEAEEAATVDHLARIEALEAAVASLSTPEGGA